MLEDHEDTCVIYTSVLTTSRDLAQYVNDNDDIIMVICDEVVDEEHLPDLLTVNEFEYELRFISSSFPQDAPFKWDGKIYCRHGGDNHPSWWVLHRNKNIFLQTRTGGLDNIDYFLLMYVYMFGKSIQKWTFFGMSLWNILEVKQNFSVRFTDYH